jgi:hypothetical protein
VRHQRAQLREFCVGVDFLTQNDDVSSDVDNTSDSDSEQPFSSSRRNNNGAAAATTAASNGLGE